MKKFRFYAPVLACAIILILAAPVAAKDKWINLTTRNFNIISNADEGDSRRLALKLEQFHHVFSTLFGFPAVRPVPVTVMVFRNEGSFRPFKPLYNGKPKNIAGYFQPSEDENLIALDISANEARPMSVIYHEYTHVLTSSGLHEWPLWLKEGMAELYSSFDVKGNDVTLGLPISSHVYLLRDNKFITLPELFSIRHNSPAYHEREKKGIFYAQSWALCHYLMYGNKNARQPQMSDFVKAINQGVDPEAAFAQAFKSDAATVDKELRRYVGNNSYSGMIYTLTSTEGEKEVSIRPLSDAEAQSYLGSLLARSNRLDEAEVLLKQAAAAEPDLPRPYEGLGVVEMRRKKYAEALEYFKQAATRGSKNHLAHYYYAEALHRQSLGHITPDLARKIREELRISLEIRPGFAQAYYAMGVLALATGENLQEGAVLLKTAIRIAPQSKHFALALGQLQVRMKDYQAAKKTLTPLLAADEPGLKIAAESTIKMIEDIERPAPTFSESPQADNPEAGSQASRASADKAPARMAGQPTLKLEGTQTIRAFLVSIECNAGKWTLVVNNRDGLLRFTVSDKDKLEFHSQDPSFEGKVGCGTVNKIAFIYFKPVGDQSRFLGDAVAVEFTR